MRVFLWLSNACVLVVELCLCVDERWMQHTWQLLLVVHRRAGGPS